MIKKILPNEYHKILAFIRDNQLVISPYIPINLWYFKSNNDNYSFFYSIKNNVYTAFVSVYYNTVQLWASENVDFQELKDFFKEGEFKVVFAPLSVLKRLSFEPEKPGYILLADLNDAYRCASCDYSILKDPSNEDFKKVAQLISKDDDINSGMRCEEIEERLRSRYLEKFGRNYLCIDNGVVIGHAGTYAESDESSVIGGVIVHPQYRGRHIATKLVEELCLDLISEGKQVFLMSHTEEAIHIYKKMGFKEYSDWGSHRF